MLCESVSWHPRNHQWVHWHIDCTDSSSLLYQRLLQTHRPGIDVVLPPFSGGSWAGRTTGDTALGCQRGVVQDGEDGPRNRRFAGWAVLGGAVELSTVGIDDPSLLQDWYALFGSGESHGISIQKPCQICQFSPLTVIYSDSCCAGAEEILGLLAEHCRWNGCFLSLGAMSHRIHVWYIC